jgi:hypothetical protein
MLKHVSFVSFESILIVLIFLFPLVCRTLRPFTRNPIIQNNKPSQSVAEFLYPSTYFSSSKMCTIHMSVGPGSMPNENLNAKAFLINPVKGYGEAGQLIIQNFNQIQSGEKKKIGIIGTQLLNANHQEMIELLSYALVVSGNHVITSGGGNGTNIAVIRGALRACNPDLLTVLLPQSLMRQPYEMQTLLSRVVNVIEQPQHDQIDLKQAANKCNYQLLSGCDQALVFVYHNSYTILAPVEEFEDQMDIIKFYLD